MLSEIIISHSSLFLLLNPHGTCDVLSLQPMLAWPSEAAGIIPNVPGATTD